MSRPFLSPNALVELWPEPCCEGPCAHEQFNDDGPILATVIETDAHVANHEFVWGYLVLADDDPTPTYVKSVMRVLSTGDNAGVL